MKLLIFYNGIETYYIIADADDNPVDFLVSSDFTLLADIDFIPGFARKGKKDLLPLGVPLNVNIELVRELDRRDAKND